jgi:methionine synthase I (cobalamin-dependent)
MGATLMQTRAAEFREALANRVLVADGAMGTMLYQKGVFINRCYRERAKRQGHMAHRTAEAESAGVGIGTAADSAVENL